MIKKIYLLLFLTFGISCIYLKGQVTDDIVVETHIVTDSISNTTYGQITVKIPVSIGYAPYNYSLFADKFLGDLLDSRRSNDNEVTFKIKDLNRNYVVAVKNGDASFVKVVQVKF